MSTDVAGTLPSGSTEGWDMTVSTIGAEAVEDRWLRLEGSVNFRDLGGYTTSDGRQVAWRRLYRADGLTRLTDSDLQVLTDRRLATVIDLRTSVERELGAFPAHRLDVQMHHFPLLERIPDAATFEMAPGMLGASYLDMVRDAGPQIGRALRTLASEGALPAVIHCAAGKDRTGVLSAVILALLGVRDEDIAEDYALSELVMGDLRAKLIARHPEGRAVIESADEMFSAAPENITRLLDAVRRSHGSVAEFAASVGAGGEVVTALRAHLLEP